MPAGGRSVKSERKRLGKGKPLPSSTGRPIKGDLSYGGTGRQMPAVRRRRAAKQAATRFADKHIGFGPDGPKLKTSVSEARRDLLKSRAVIKARTEDMIAPGLGKITRKLGYDYRDGAYRPPSVKVRKGAKAPVLRTSRSPKGMRNLSGQTAETRKTVRRLALKQAQKEVNQAQEKGLYKGSTAAGRKLGARREAKEVSGLFLKTPAEKRIWKRKTQAAQRRAKRSVRPKARAAARRRSDRPKDKKLPKAPLALAPQYRTKRGYRVYQGQTQLAELRNLGIRPFQRKKGDLRTQARKQIKERTPKQGDFKGKASELWKLAFIAGDKKSAARVLRSMRRSVGYTEGAASLGDKLDMPVPKLPKKMRPTKGKGRKVDVEKKLEYTGTGFETKTTSRRSKGLYKETKREVREAVEGIPEYEKILASNVDTLGQALNWATLAGGAWTLGPRMLGPKVAAKLRAGAAGAEAQLGGGGAKQIGSSIGHIFKDLPRAAGRLGGRFRASPITESLNLGKSFGKGAIGKRGRRFTLSAAAGPPAYGALVDRDFRAAMVHDPLGRGFDALKRLYGGSWEALKDDPWKTFRTTLRAPVTMVGAFGTMGLGVAGTGKRALQTGIGEGWEALGFGKPTTYSGREITAPARGAADMFIKSALDWGHTIANGSTEQIADLVQEDMGLIPAATPFIVSRAGFSPLYRAARSKARWHREAKRLEAGLVRPDWDTLKKELPGVEPRLLSQEGQATWPGVRLGRRDIARAKTRLMSVKASRVQVEIAQLQNIVAGVKGSRKFWHRRKGQKVEWKDPDTGQTRSTYLAPEDVIGLLMESRVRSSSLKAATDDLGTLKQNIIDHVGKEKAESTPDWQVFTYLEQNPHLLTRAKSPRLWRAVDKAKEIADELTLSEVARWKPFAEDHSIPMANARVPLAAREHTKAETRPDAFADLDRLNREVEAVTKRERRLKAKVAQLNQLTKTPQVRKTLAARKRELAAVRGQRTKLKNRRDPLDSSLNVKAKLDPDEVEELTVALRDQYEQAGMELTPKLLKEELSVAASMKKYRQMEREGGELHEEFMNDIAQALREQEGLPPIVGAAPARPGKPVRGGKPTIKVREGTNLIVDALPGQLREGHRRFKLSKKGRQYKSSLSPLKLKDWEEAPTRVISDDYTAGGAVTAEGEIIGLFNFGKRGQGETVLKELIEQADPTNLSAYGKPLRDLYKRHGFRTRQRAKFDPQFLPEPLRRKGAWRRDPLLKHRPDVFFMERKAGGGGRKPPQEMPGLKTDDGMNLPPSLPLDRRPSIYPHYKQSVPSGMPFLGGQPGKPKERMVGAATTPSGHPTASAQYTGEVGYRYTKLLESFQRTSYSMGRREWMNYIRQMYSIPIKMKDGVRNKFTRRDIRALGGEEGKRLKGMVPVDSRLLDDPHTSWIRDALENGDVEQFFLRKDMDDWTSPQGEGVTKGVKEGEGRFYYLMREDAVDELIGQLQRDAVLSQSVKVLGTIPSRLILATSLAWMVAQPFAEGLALGLTTKQRDLWPAIREVQRIYRKGTFKEREDLAVMSDGVSGNHLTPQELQSSIARGKSLREKLPGWKIIEPEENFVRPGKTGRVAKNVAGFRYPGMFDRWKGNFIREVGAVAEIRRIERQADSFGEGLRGTRGIIEHVSTELSKLPNRQAQIKWLRDNPIYGRVLQERLDDMLGNWNALTKKERAVAPFMLFYPFMRFSLNWTFRTFPKRHPIKTAIGLNLAQANAAQITKLLGGDPQFLSELGNVPYFGEGPGKPTDVIPLTRIIPGGNAIVEAAGGAENLWAFARILNPALLIPMGTLAQIDSFGRRIPKEEIPENLLKQITSLSPLTQGIAQATGLVEQSPAAELYRDVQGGEADYWFRRAAFPFLPYTATEYKRKGKLNRAFKAAFSNPEAFLNEQRKLQGQLDQTATGAHVMPGATPHKFPWRKETKERLKEIKQNKKKQIKGEKTLKGFYKRYGIEPEHPIKIDTGKETASGANVMPGKQPKMAIPFLGVPVPRETADGKPVDSPPPEATQQQAGTQQPGMRNKPLMANWTPDEAATLLFQVGATKEEAETLSAYLMGESGGDVNIPNAEGSGAFGLWQIMVPVHQDKIARAGGPMSNPIANSRVALEILRSQGTGAWEAAPGTPGRVHPNAKRGVFAHGNIPGAGRLFKGPPPRKGRIEYGILTQEQREGIQPITRKLGQVISARIGSPISLSSGYRPGDPKEHGVGHALDIEASSIQNGGSPADQRRGDAIAMAAIIAGGGTRKEARDFIRNGGGWIDVYGPAGRVQVGWRTMDYGNHHNHVHVGIDPGSAGGSTSYSGGGSSYLGGTGTSGVSGGGAISSGTASPMELLNLVQNRREPGIFEEFMSGQQEEPEAEEEEADSIASLFAEFEEDTDVRKKRRKLSVPYGT